MILSPQEPLFVRLPLTHCSVYRLDVEPSFEKFPKQTESVGNFILKRRGPTDTVAEHFSVAPVNKELPNDRNIQNL